MATTRQDHGEPYSATSGSLWVATATAPAVANKTFYVTDISGSSTNPFGTITVLNGSTVLWQAIAGGAYPGGGNYEHSFVEPLKCSVGATCTVVSAGTLVATASLAGFYLNNT